MKKIIACLGLAACMLIPLVAPAHAQSAQGDTNANEKKPKATFQVISDLHIRDTPYSHNKFLKALQDLHSIDPQVDAMVINGDITNNGFPEEYAKARELLDQSPKPKNLYMTIGNHEFFNGEGNEVNTRRFADFIEEERVYYEKIVKGYPFIFLGSESWGPVDSPAKDHAYLSDEQLIWLEDTLEKRSKSEKPMFVFLHQPLSAVHETAEKRLTDLFSKYPQVILFTGHTHRDMRLPNINLTQSKFTSINTASVYYTTFAPTVNWDESQGLYVQIYDDRVVVQGRDFYRKQWIPEAHYTIDVQSATTFSYRNNYVIPGEAALLTSTFTNYGENTIEAIQLDLTAPDGWSVEAVNDPLVTNLSPGSSIETDWRVTPPDTAEPGFANLKATVSFEYGGDNKQSEWSADSIVWIPERLPAADSYVSDVEWIHSANHWGPVERDQSNGERAKGDGKTITIGGEKYTKGLGVHANAEITYYTGGNFSTFTADIGIDDEVGNRGAVVFQIWADTEKVYDSGLVTGSDSVKKVQADISGANVLKLVVTDGGDGTGYDHADWANAHIARSNVNR
ncbi:NPCBM/NEW2 domain-containing protein [Paenibacillus sp. MDMC362]|uniref:NPCBM/NEW2 domain-containing protein n=1 Tax=Paenibacillus sp. MDMC362 TaxID=2977365 RepID=UPI000DC200F4|nr:NPCBM/NEW2 domain-containing protein [Paenibacillus sp. MDMC362]RAR42801.1 hypothetical protein DP091_16830 [Paenibacillus sp. MDMC362]